MTTPAQDTAADEAAAKAAEAAAKAAADKAEADKKAGIQGNPTPEPVKADAPKPEPTDEEKAAAEAKAKEDAEAKAKAEADEGNEGDEGGEEGEGEEKELDTDVWGTTGNEVADSVLQMLQNADVTPDEAKSLLFDPVREGDVSKIDQAALTEKVGKAKATLIMAGINNFVSQQQQRNQTILNDVYSAAGGEENWKAVVEWVNKNIPEDQRNEYKDMINSGGAQARFAVTEMATAYNADSNNTTIEVGGSAPVIEGDGGSNVSNARATTKAEFADELNKAIRKGASEKEIQEIHAARHRGRAKGI